MKLKSVRVTKLFGVFDHEIPLNLDTGITIVIGENGLGKTVLLEMIEALFKSDYLYFDKVPFAELILQFSDLVIWRVTKESARDQAATVSSLTLTEEKGDSVSEAVKLISFDPIEIRHL